MATDGRQKYVYYPWGGTEQLFDLERDPAECHDLAQQATHAALLDACRARLGTAFPELLAAAPTGHPFRVIDEPLPDAARGRAPHPDPGRGPHPNRGPREFQVARQRSDQVRHPTSGRG
jgi:hypothetical protein